ncbi:MAG: hypothetical protein H0U41_06955 [Actinobacteria bacterium]|nr:hypothetical protein [Actinomycetota bacterium]
MTPLDKREKRFARWAAGFGAVSAVAFYAPGFDESAGLVLAFVGVAMAGLLVMATRSGSRLFTCLAAGLLGIGPWGYAYIIGLPFILLAGWLISRDAVARRTARGSRVRTRPVEARAVRDRPVRDRPVKEKRVREKRVREKRGREKKVAEEPAPHSRPGASKRYTPPRGRR